MAPARLPAVLVFLALAGCVAPFDVPTAAELADGRYECDKTLRVRVAVEEGRAQVTVRDGAGEGVLSRTLREGESIDETLRGAAGTWHVDVKPGLGTTRSSQTVSCIRV